MKLVKLSNIKCNLPNSKGGYNFPKYNITGSSDFLFGLLLGVKNSGKTVCVLNYLIHEPHLLEGQNKAYFFSPTFDAKLQNFKEKHPDNFIWVEDFNIKTFTDVIATIKEEIKKWKENRLLLDVFELYLKDKKKVDLEMIELLEQNNYLQDFDFENFSYCHPPIHTIIIDDNLGNSMISSRGKDAAVFTKWAIAHRHMYSNLFILSQYPKLVNKVIRTNANIINIWPLRDESIYHSIFEEFASLFKGDIKKFLEVMKMIEDRHDFSFVTIYYDATSWVRINFNELVILD
jgi:hypothetical protein